MKDLIFRRCGTDWTWLAIALAFMTFGSISSALADETPSWKKPTPGTVAILGDDGGGKETATVCDTISHYIDFSRDKNPPGCKQFQHGLEVIIRGLVYDVTSDDLPLVRILIPSQKFTGFLELFGGTHPKIPQGTPVHLQRRGNDTLRLAASRDADFDAGPDLGDQANAKVIRYDPSTDDRDLYVTIIDGPLAGKSGWIFSLEGDGDDGKPLDEFEFSILDKGQTIPDAYLYHAPAVAAANRPDPSDCQAINDNQERLRCFDAATGHTQPNDSGAWAYNPHDYRKGETAHRWPQHGVWYVELEAGGGEGSDICDLITEAGANVPTFFLFFGSEPMMLSLTWGDTNFTATNTENYDLRARLGLPMDKVSLSVGDWDIFRQGEIRHIISINGQRFAMAYEPNIAWETPGREANSISRLDGPDALSEDQLLDRIAKGRTLDFNDGGNYRRSIPLAGFGDAVKDFHKCVRALLDQ